MTDRFTEKANQWDENPARQAMSDAFYREITKKIPLQNNFKLLEFGCGTGLVGLKFQKTVQHLTLLDTSDAMLNVLREKITLHQIDNAQIIHSDITSIKWDEKQFDGIFSSMAFHHVHNIPEVLSIFYRILKPGGFIAIADLMKEDGSFHKDETVEHNGFDLEELKSLFFQAGFTVKSAYPYHRIKRPDSAGNMREYEQFFLWAEK